MPLLVRNVSAKWGWVIKTTSQHPPSKKKPKFLLQKRLYGKQGRSVQVRRRENLLPPARDQNLYRVASIESFILKTEENHHSEQ
jgi:hypothetical protein